MSKYDDDYEDFDEALDAHLTEEPVKPPEGMKLTIEVGLAEYSPGGLLELIARGLMKEIGGRDRWAELLKHHVVKLGKQRAEALVNEEFEKLWRDGAAGLDFVGIVRKASEEYLDRKVNSRGEDENRYDSSKMTRREWFVRKLTSEAMEGAFRQAEVEWKAATQEAIKETLAEVLAARLTKALPTPPELRP